MKWLGAIYFSLFGAYWLLNGIASYRRHDTWAFVSWKGSMTPPAAILAGSVTLIFVAYFVIASGKSDADRRSSSRDHEP